MGQIRSSKVKASECSPYAPEVIGGAGALDDIDWAVLKSLGRPRRLDDAPREKAGSSLPPGTLEYRTTQCKWVPRRVDYLRYTRMYKHVFDLTVRGARAEYAYLVRVFGAA